MLLGDKGTAIERYVTPRGLLALPLPLLDLLSVGRSSGGSGGREGGCVCGAGDGDR